MKRYYKNHPLSLRENFFWTFIGNAIYAGSQWGMLIILAKFGNPEMVGIFSLALAIVSPIIMLTNLELRGVQVTDTKNMYNFNDYLGLRITTSLIALLILLIVIAFSGYPLNTVIVIFIMFVAKVIESISDVTFGLLQKKEIMNRISLSMIFKGILSLILLAIMVMVTKSLIFGTFGLALSWLIILIFYDIRNIKIYESIKPIFNISILINVAKLSLPLGIVVMMGSINTNLPRYFLEYYINEESLGYFAAMAYLLVAGNTVINALAQSATPRLAKYFSNGDKKKFATLLLKMTGIGLLIGIIGLFLSWKFGEEILTILYTAEFAKYSNVFVLIMIAGVINYSGSFLGYGMTAARYFKIQPFIGLLWVITSLISSIILIPSKGLFGASYVLIISSVVQLITKLLVIIHILYRPTYLQNSAQKDC